MEKTMLTMGLFCSIFLFSFAEKRENSEGITNLVFKQDTSKPQETARVRAISLEERRKASPDFNFIATVDNVTTIVRHNGEVSTDTFMLIDYYSFLDYRAKKNGQPIDTTKPRPKIPTFEHDTTPMAVYGFTSGPQFTKAGHCYTRCKISVDEYSEWREMLCEDKITQDLVINIVKKLKLGGYLAANFESDSLTQDVRNALSIYQDVNHLPCGDLNLATMAHLGIKF